MENRDEIPAHLRADGAAIDLLVRRQDARSPIRARNGETLLAALTKAGLPVMSVCGGRAACGSCKVGLDPAWSDRLPPPGKAEGRLLRHLPDVRPGDRLACQITLTPLLDGLEVRLAA
jgi:ferredoxin